jgi:hypothetical protein
MKESIRFFWQPLIYGSQQKITASSAFDTVEHFPEKVSSTKERGIGEKKRSKVLSVAKNWTSPTVCFADLDKVKNRNDGSVLCLSQFLILQSCLKKMKFSTNMVKNDLKIII